MKERGGNEEELVENVPKKQRERNCEKKKG